MTNGQATALKEIQRSLANAFHQLEQLRDDIDADINESEACEDDRLRAEDELAQVDEAIYHAEAAQDAIPAV